MKYILFILLMSMITLNSLAQDMNTEWEQFTTYLRIGVPLYHSRLKPGASPGAVAALEKKLMVKLPPDVHTLYSLNNGEDEAWFVGGAMLGLRFLTLEGVVRKWTSLGDVEDKHHFNDRWDGPSFPSNAVKPAAFIKHWIPIFTDDNGNYIGIDLSPGPSGKFGQVINFGTDEYDHYVFADSLIEFIKLMNEQFKNGTVAKAIFKNEEGKNVVFGLVRESHLTDDLKSLQRSKK